MVLEEVQIFRVFWFVRLIQLHKHIKLKGSNIERRKQIYGGASTCSSAFFGVEFVCHLKV
jgi:hypothetical protein